MLITLQLLGLRQPNCPVPLSQPHITPNHRPPILIALQLLGLRQPNCSVPLSQLHSTPNHRPPILVALQLLGLRQPNCSVPLSLASVCTLSNFPNPSTLSHNYWDKAR